MVTDIAPGVGPASAGSRVKPWAGVALLVSVIAAWMATGPMHTWQNADSLIPILVSLQKWTPFYWMQDRYGMLVPLLAMPVRDPFMNLVVQGWLMTAAGLLAPFLVARSVTSDPRRWFEAGAVANILLLMLTGINSQFDWLVMEPYGLSLSLAAGGIIAARQRNRGSLVVAMLLMVLAHWVNFSVIVVAASLVALHRPFSGRAFASVTIGAAAGAALSRVAASHTPSELLPLSEWPHAWSALMTSARSALNSQALAAIAVATVLATVWLLIRRTQPQSVEAAVVLLAVGTIHWLVTGTSAWVQTNLYFARYVYPSMLMAAVAVGLITSATLAGRLQWMPAALVVALLGLTVIDHGRPSPAALRLNFDRKFGAMTPEILMRGVAVIGGDYWTVWPAVFHANLVLHKQHERSTIYGLTLRSEMTNPLWTDRLTDIRLASSPGDQSVQGWMNTIPLVTQHVEHLRALDLFVTRTAAAAAR